ASTRAFQPSGYMWAQRGIERDQPPDRPVRELRREVAVPPRELAPTERRVRGDRRVGAPLRDAADHLQSDRARVRTRRRGHVTLLVAHSMRSPGSGRAPRTNAAADIRRLPCGLTSMRRSEPLPVATSRPFS